MPVRVEKFKNLQNKACLPSRLCCVLGPSSQLTTRRSWRGGWPRKHGDEDHRRRSLFLLLRFESKMVGTSFINPLPSGLLEVHWKFFLMHKILRHHIYFWVRYFFSVGVQFALNPLYISSSPRQINRRRSVLFVSSPSVEWTWISCWIYPMSS